MIPQKPSGLILDSVQAAVLAGDAEGAALLAAIYAAVGAWRDGRAQEHLLAVRASVNGEIVPAPEILVECCN